MSDYHVGCGIAGIYAGTMKKNGYEWINKSDVTDEAISAVAQHMFYKIPKGENRFGYKFKMFDGSKIKLIVEKEG